MYKDAVPPVLSVVGYTDSGKTTYLEKRKSTIDIMRLNTYIWSLRILIFCCYSRK